MKVIFRSISLFLISFLWNQKLNQLGTETDPKTFESACYWFQWRSVLFCCIGFYLFTCLLTTCHWFNMFTVFVSSSVFSFSCCMKHCTDLSTLPFQPCLPYLIEHIMMNINSVMGIMLGLTLFWVCTVSLYVSIMIVLCLPPYVTTPTSLSLTLSTELHNMHWWWSWCSFLYKTSMLPCKWSTWL